MDGMKRCCNPRNRNTRCGARFGIPKLLRTGPARRPMNRQNSHETVDHSSERTLRRPPRPRPGSIGMVAYQRQDPDPLASTLLFSLPLAVAYAFGLFMEIGSIGSALVYFRRDIRSLFHARRLVVYLLVVTIVTGLVGAPLYYLTDKVLSTSPYNLGIPMVLLGLVLIGTGLYIGYSRATPRLVVGLGEMRLKNYVMVGIAQGMAALPGSN